MADGEHPLSDRTRYDPSEVEPRIVARWLDSGLFHPDPDEAIAAEQAGTAHFSVAIPPPNVTGVLHMGHALNNTLQDALVRHARMAGRPTKWILGTDHAGIATQTQVEKALAAEGTSRQELGRDAFVERVWSWREQYGGQIVAQLKRLGASCDFAEERFTLDDGYAEAVVRVFVALHAKGYIYRDRYLVNWDPGSRSAISDLEVEDREVTDTLYSIRYPLASGAGAVTVATVRPETMLGDVAVAVHPDDERYAHLVGQEVLLPLTDRRLPVIADGYVKRDFGTGALKITPGHDPNDFEIGRRHGLPQMTVIGEDGRMIAPAPERFAGLPALAARDAVIAELEAAGLIAGTEPLVHNVPFSHRSGERIEPLISLQWFMDMGRLAEPAIAAVRRGEVRFHPDGQAKVYLDWMENIRPWCISRQLWWGHRIPVWYRGEETYVGTTAPEGDGWRRDPDVLDTWFSSALWPFATLGWPDREAPGLLAFYPTSVLSTGRDIIFLWVARMIMMGLEFMGEIPFSDVCVHSIIQAPDGRRMSKSLGTGIDPLALIEGGPRPPVFAARPGEEPGEFPAYGADAVRWGLAAMSSTQDVRFSEEKVLQGQRLANKLWNASRLVLMSLADASCANLPAEPHPAAVEDRWILSRLLRARQAIDGRLAAFDFAHAALELYDFVFEELCDWYLELVKPRLREPDAELAATVLYLLSETLALAHPLIPFVTEEIWAHVPGAEGLLAGRVSAPAVAAAAAVTVDPAAEAEIGALVGAVRAVRRWREDAGVGAGARVRARVSAPALAATGGHLARLAALDVVESNGPPEDVVAAVPVPGGTVELFAGGGLDAGALEARREKQRGQLRGEIARAEGKLGNEGFLAKAPPHVVAAEREKLARLCSDLEALG